MLVVKPSLPQYSCIQIWKEKVWEVLSHAVMSRRQTVDRRCQTVSDSQIHIGQSPVSQTMSCVNIDLANISASSPQTDIIQHRASQCFIGQSLLISSHMTRSLRLLPSYWTWSASFPGLPCGLGMRLGQDQILEAVKGWNVATQYCVMDYKTAGWHTFGTRDRYSCLSTSNSPFVASVIR